MQYIRNERTYPGPPCIVININTTSAVSFCPRSNDQTLWSVKTALVALLILPQTALSMAKWFIHEQFYLGNKLRPHDSKSTDWRKLQEQKHSFNANETTAHQWTRVSATTTSLLDTQPIQSLVHKVTLLSIFFSFKRLVVFQTYKTIHATHAHASTNIHFLCVYVLSNCVTMA